MSSFAIPHPARRIRRVSVFAFAVAATFLLAVLVWQGITSYGNPNPTAPQTTSSAAACSISGCYLSEGLGVHSQLAAITCGHDGETTVHWRPVAVGAGVGFSWRRSLPGLLL